MVDLQVSARRPSLLQQAIRNCLNRFSWCICMVYGRGFISFEDVNTLLYNYATATEIGYLIVPQVQHYIAGATPPLCSSHWAEWQSVGAVPCYWTETTHLCRTLQCSILAHACEILSRRDLGRWLLSLRMANRRCRRHALMAAYHIVPVLAVREARSRWVGFMRTFWAERGHTDSNVLR